MTEEKEKRKTRTRAEIEHDRRFREVRRAFADGRMPLLLRRYLIACGVESGDDISVPCGREVPFVESEKKSVRSVQSDTKTAKTGKRLPNPAGFCRFLDLEREAYERLEAEFPVEVGRMRAIFEDEALNAALPASVLGFYLKYLLGEKEEDGDGVERGDGGEIFVSFAHDILTDGR